jgi:preprotein translocase subunit SecE
LIVVRIREPVHQKELKMNKIVLYCKDSYRELVEKVTWPTWSQLQQSTTIVLAATAMITFLVWIMDAAISRVLQAFYSIVK